MAMTEQERKRRREARKREREEAEEAARLEAEKTQKPVRRLAIVIEWKKSATWGRNPRATARAEFADGTCATSVHKCGGCGYDKESTVIAEAFNTYLKYLLYRLTDEQVKGGHGSGDSGPAPYGICVYDGRRHFSGGIGANCYYDIAKHIGGEFRRVGGSGTSDVYEFTTKE
jgi:hypothetical protein